MGVPDLSAMKNLSAEEEKRFDDEYASIWLKYGTGEEGYVSDEEVGRIVRKVYEVRLGSCPADLDVYLVDSPPAGLDLQEKLTGEPRNKIIEENRYFFGCHMAHLFAFYSFAVDVKDVDLLEHTDSFFAFRELAICTSWWIFYDKAAIGIRKPIIRLDENGNIGSRDAAAIEYPDGQAVYIINQTRVPGELITTPPEKLDVVKFVLEEDNAQIRAEAIRRIGIERVLSKVDHDVLDEDGDYALLDLSKNFDRSGITWRYLKMKNPSVPELWHVEKVGGECKTVSEALHWRKPDELRELPIDDENGAEWYAQGDVVVWPEDAESVKSRPSLQT